MKILKGLAIFAILNALLGCFDPPEYSVIPQIDFLKIEFVEVGGFSDTDSLNIYLDFTDGDGDLGLSSDQIADPYHDSNYFLADDSGVLTPIPTWNKYSNLPPLIKLEENLPGKLATARTRNQPAYSYLPAFSSDSCYYYRYSRGGTLDTAYYKFDEVYVEAQNSGIFDDTYNIIDTLVSGNVNQPNIYVLEDTFYYEPNPYHNNIMIEFLVRETVGTDVIWKRFDWFEFNCALTGTPGTSYDARFPVLADKTRAVEGTLKYAMLSSGFLTIFSIKVMKLRVTVWDRALHKSNTIETPEFTLMGIRKG